MKKLMLIIFMLAGLSYSQYHQDGWGLGFGLNSVRYMGDVIGEDLNFGGNVYVQRDLSPSSGFRARLDYNHFTGTNVKVTTDHFNFSLGYIYRFFLEDEIKPYVGVGFSTMYAKKKNETLNLSKSHIGEITADLFFGAYFDWLPENWMLKGEFGQHTTSTDQFDFVGAPGGGGLFGGSLDSYIRFEVGVIYFWERTPMPKAADIMPSGVVCCEKDQHKKMENKLNELDNKLNQILYEIEKIK